MEGQPGTGRGGEPERGVHLLTEAAGGHQHEVLDQLGVLVGDLERETTAVAVSDEGRAGHVELVTGVPDQVGQRSEL